MLRNYHNIIHKSSLQIFTFHILYCTIWKQQKQKFTESLTMFVLRVEDYGTFECFNCFFGKLPFFHATKYCGFWSSEKILLLFPDPLTYFLNWSNLYSHKNKIHQHANYASVILVVKKRVEQFSLLNFTLN